MVRVAIAGLGFMGKMHFRCYKPLENATVAAVCDADKSRLQETSGTAGNIAGAEQPLDLTGIALYTDFDKMLADLASRQAGAKLDAVSITLPTYLHRDFTVKALEAGLNVLCEKPMALTVQQCEEMIAAAEKSGSPQSEGLCEDSAVRRPVDCRRILQIGHCIRFWPEYAKTKEIIDSGQYGKVKAATFQRLSSTPTWSWNNWMVTGAQSGGALIDLHIHDSDFVQWLFGMPKAVNTRGVIGPTGEFDHVVTQYSYDDDKVITAEGGWMMTAGFGFEMSFNIVLEKATIVYNCTQEPTFRLCPVEGEPVTPPIEAGDGYSREIEHFVKAVSGQKVPEITTLTQALNTIKLLLAEKQSAQSGKEVAVQ